MSRERTLRRDHRFEQFEPVCGDRKMFGKSLGGRAVALALGLAGALAVTGCDERPQQKSERAPAEKPPAGAQPQRVETAEPGPPVHVKPGARPETDAASMIGTWRVRVVSGAGGPEGITYTFTADGRVTVGPGQTCRYRIENQTLAIDCAGTTAESASGRLERRDANLLVWSVDEKTVHLERQVGVKEQQ
jgi:hypothetical protein